MSNSGSFWNAVLFGNNRVQPEPSPEERAQTSIEQLIMNASQFIILFELDHRSSMQQSVQTCRRKSERLKQHQYTLKACMGFSLLLVVLTIILIVVIISYRIYNKSLHTHFVINGGISKEMQKPEGIRECPIDIDLFIILTSAAPTFVYFILTQIEKVHIVCKVNSSTQDFRRKLSLLIPKLEEVKRVCEDLRRRSWSVLGGTERVNIMRLEQSVLEVFVLTESLTVSASAGSVTQVYEEYSRTLAELDKMKVQLSYYSGTAILIESDFVD